MKKLKGGAISLIAAVFLAKLMCSAPPKNGIGEIILVFVLGLWFYKAFEE